MVALATLVAHSYSAARVAADGAVLAAECYRGPVGDMARQGVAGLPRPDNLRPRRFVLMKSRFLLLALFLVAACSSTDVDEAKQVATGQGTGAAAAGGAPPMRTSPARPGGFDQGALQPVETARQLAEAGADRVYFTFDSYDLDTQARGILERQARLLNTQQGVNATIEGHCDERGTREYNIALGERRASAVRDYLIALGVAPSRLRVVSFGEERPAAVGSSEEVFAQNRRAVTVVIGAAAGS